MRFAKLIERTLGFALAASTLAFCPPASATSKDIDFKGFVFGKTTLSEWRNAVYEVGPDVPGQMGFTGTTITLAPYCDEEGRYSDQADAPLGIKRCSWYSPDSHLKNFSVGQAATQDDEWIFFDGVLTSFWATMYVSQLPNLLPSLRAKYGPPSEVRNEVLKNAFGATFDNQILEWQLGRTRIKVIEYFGDLNTSEIVIWSPDLAKELNRRKAAKPVDKTGL